MASSTATLDHENMTCPACNHGFIAGEIVTTCDTCGTVHHVLCCDTAGECRACHPTWNGTLDYAKTLEPEITICVRETRAITPPPPRQPDRSPLELAVEFTPNARPSSIWLARLAAVVSILSVAALPGLAIDWQSLVVVGCVFAILGAAIGIIAALLNWSRRKLSLASVGAVAFSCAVIMVVGFWTNHRYRAGALTAISSTDIQDSRPADEKLAALSRPIADALRANVVILSETLAGQTLGSGVVTRVAEDRVHVLTNKHVVGEGEITVHFQNGQITEGDIEWLAPGEIDMAYLACTALPGAKYTAVRVERGTASVGDPAFAVGNPSYLPWTYTWGVISSTRTSQFGKHALDVYQTQTPINPGSSGGGLYNHGGALIGVNTWTRSGADSEGIGFSISSYSLLTLLSADETCEFVEQVVP